MNAQHDMTSLSPVVSDICQRERRGKDAICICIFSLHLLVIQVSHTDINNIVSYCRVRSFVRFLCPVSVELLMKEITALGLPRRYPRHAVFDYPFCT